MNRILAGLCALTLLMPQTSLAQTFTPNSRYFSVTEYFSFDSNGDLRPYRVAGFAQPPGLNLDARLFILPTVSLDRTSVRYADASGTSFTPSGNSRVASTISIAGRIANALPNAMQTPAIAATLDGLAAQPAFLPASLKDNFGNPIIHPTVQGNPGITQAIYQAYFGYDQAIAAQKAIADKYTDYLPQQANLNELEAHLVIDGERIASRRFTGTQVNTTGVLPAITLVGPTLAQQNKIRDGAYEIELSYRFLDTSVGVINANFDFREIVNAFLSETQEAITKNRSSGFQVFHIGSRRSKVTTRITQQVDSQFSGQRIQGTRIVTYDASDDLFAQFEAQFFPQLQREQVIQNHLDAAAVASAAGDTSLAKVHQDYAQALATSNSTAEVDAVGAAAALNAGDYATFIAKGVRASSNNDVRANSFRRIVTFNSDTSTTQNWSQARQVTGQREVSMTVQPLQPRDYRPRIGLCDAAPLTFPVLVPNGYGGVQQSSRSGLLVTCVQQGSPAAAANLLPGLLILSIAGRPTTSAAELDNALAGYNPGDNISVTVFDQPFGQPPGQRTLSVRLKQGLPRDLGVTL